jgi:hypothetical protein
MLLAVSALPSAQATIVSVTGSGVLIPAPPSVGDPDHPDPIFQQGFDEKQGVFLFGALPVDFGAIGPGITVDSHMIFFNQPGTGAKTAVATWTFSGAIVGVMSDSDGALEFASNPIFAVPGTGYPGPYGPGSLRGMEPDDSYSLASATSLTVRMHIDQPGDWIRVLTLSPVPDDGNVGVLLAMACAAMTATWRGRRRR